MLSVLWVYDLPLAMVATAFVPLLVACVVAHHPSAKRRSREAMENGGCCIGPRSSFSMCNLEF